MFKKSIIYSLFICASLLFSCSKFQKVQKSNDWNVKYQAAERYYSKKDYYKAGLLYEDIIPIIKGRSEAESVEFKLAYAYYYQKQYLISSTYFKSFYESYNASLKAEEALYMYTYTLSKESPIYNLDQESTIEAIDAIQNFINRYPDSQYIEEVNNILTKLRYKLELKDFENAKLYYKIRNYKSAIISFSNFQKSFPDSRFVEEAAFLKIQSTYLLAKLSIDKVKKERFNSAIELYENFVDNYPVSKYIREAENIYKNSIEEITQLAKK